MAENATDEEIKTALHQLFSYGPQGPSSRQDQLAPQGQTVLQDPQGPILIEDTSPQGKTTNASILLSTVISKIQLDSTIKNSLTSALRQEAPYSQILVELEGGARQTILNSSSLLRQMLVM